MEPLQLYFIKASGLLALFFAVYYVLLRKETFFTGNRWFLLLGLVTSAVFPLLTYTEIIWVDPNPNPIDWSNIPVSNYKTEAPPTINWWLISSICYGLGVLYLSRKVYSRHIQTSANSKNANLRNNKRFHFCKYN